MIMITHTSVFEFMTEHAQCKIKLKVDNQAASAGRQGGRAKVALPTQVGGEEGNLVVTRDHTSPSRRQLLAVMETRPEACPKSR